MIRSHFADTRRHHCCSKVHNSKTSSALSSRHGLKQCPAKSARGYAATGPPRYESPCGSSRALSRFARLSSHACPGSSSRSDGSDAQQRHARGVGARPAARFWFKGGRGFARDHSGADTVGARRLGLDRERVRDVSVGANRVPRRREIPSDLLELGRREAVVLQLPPSSTPNYTPQCLVALQPCTTGACRTATSLRYPPQWHIDLCATAGKEPPW